MKKFKSMLKEVSEEGTMQVQKSVQTEAPKKEVSVSKSVDMLAKDKSVANILDNLFILKSVKRGLGEDLTEAQKSAFLNAINEKAGTVIADISEIIPSGFTGNFIQDMYAQTQMSQLFGYESISNFGITDAIGDFGMTAYIMDELGTISDSNDVVIDFMYLGKKFGAKTYFSAEALNDANINLLDNKRMGLMRAMAVGLEQAIISGQAGDNGIASNDTRNLFRGLRKYGLTNYSKTSDFKKRIDYNLKKWDVNQKDFIEFIKYISLYLFFIAKKPLHPVGTPFESDIKGVFEENGVYYCNSKKRYIKEDNSLCLYCVAKKS